MCGYKYQNSLLKINKNLRVITSKWKKINGRAIPTVMLQLNEVANDDGGHHLSSMPSTACLLSLS